MAIGSAAAAHGMLCSACTASPSGARASCRRQPWPVLAPSDRPEVRSCSATAAAAHTPSPAMPPHASSSGDRQRNEVGLGRELVRGPGQRSASFHGRGEEQKHQLSKQRPKTQPDLLAGLRGRSFRAADALPEPAARRTPSKVLVSVAVLRSMWPLHVMASAEWSVADLVAAAVELYVKERRRPLLPSSQPAAFGLHYSQFCLEGLDPREKVMELGSRSFFLCPRSTSATAIAASSSCSSAGASRAGDDREAPTAAGEPPAWLRFMPFWPTM